MKIAFVGLGRMGAGMTHRLLDAGHEVHAWNRSEGPRATLASQGGKPAETLEELAAFAPVHVVLGNNDGPDVEAWGAPERLSLTLGGVAIAMIHDSGVATGRAPRLRRLFPDAALVVFGHSHIPMDGTKDGQRMFNPGSPTDRRRQPRGTMGELIIEDGALVSARIFAVT